MLKCNTIVNKLLIPMYIYSKQVIDTYLTLPVYINVCVYVCVERERERKTETERDRYICAEGREGRKKGMELYK